MGLEKIIDKILIDCDDETDDLLEAIEGDPELKEIFETNIKNKKHMIEQIQNLKNCSRENKNIIISIINYTSDQEFKKLTWQHLFLSTKARSDLKLEMAEKTNQALKRKLNETQSGQEYVKKEEERIKKEFEDEINSLQVILHDNNKKLTEYRKTSLVKYIKENNKENQLLDGKTLKTNKGNKGPQVKDVKSVILLGKKG